MILIIRNLNLISVQSWTCLVRRHDVTTKLVQLRPLASFFVFVLMDLDSINTQKKNLVYSEPLYLTLGQQTMFICHLTLRF